MTGIRLVPLERNDREQFILDNQEAFNYGALEEFGMRDDHPDPNGHYDGDGNTENEKDGMFRFQKKMKQTVSDM